MVSFKANLLPRQIEQVSNLVTVFWYRTQHLEVLARVPRGTWRSRVPQAEAVRIGLMLQYEHELSERLGFALDPNNNSSVTGKRGEKYGLRPRTMRRKNVLSDFEEIPLVHAKKCHAEKVAKPKSAPLSKYRRKTANARERTRMKEINQAFETLRKAVPQITPNLQQNEKLTKITTLRLAMKYIAALSAALSSSPAELPQQDIFSECSELESFLLESDGESLPVNSDLSDHSLTPQQFCVDFDDSLTSVDFSSDFSDHLPFDTYLNDFS